LFWEQILDKADHHALISQLASLAGYVVVRVDHPHQP
jgi:hypothetical protein